MSKIQLSLQASLTKSSSNLSSLSEQCLSLKLSLWEASSRKKYLKKKLSQFQPSCTSEVFLSELQSKHNRFKGSCLEKVLSNLIKSYKIFQKTSQSLSILKKEKKNLFYTYQQTTANLYQENNLTQRLASLQKSLCEKERIIEENTNKLGRIKNEHEKLKSALDSGEVRKVLEKRTQLKNELERAVEGQPIFLREIEKTEREIENEKSVNCVTTDDAFRAIRQRIKEVEVRLAACMQKIQNRERVRDKLKVQIEKKRPTQRSFTKSLCLELARPKAFMPKNRSINLLSSLSTPAYKLSSRNSTITLFNQSSEKFFLSFGAESQSFASKIVQKNRGNFFK